MLWQVGHRVTPSCTGLDPSAQQGLGGKQLEGKMGKGEGSKDARGKGGNWVSWGKALIKSLSPYPARIGAGPGVQLGAGCLLLTAAGPGGWA